jgi:hypothetical protein
MNTVGLRKVKRPAGAGVWRAYVLGKDEHGLWLFTPKGSRYRGVNQAGRVAELEVGQGNRDAGCSVVGLVAPNAWWAAVWCDREGCVPGRGDPLPYIAIDVCTPPVLMAGEWVFEDLELDLQRSEDGRVWIDDEDEFAYACEAGLISDVERIAARSAADELHQLLAVSAEPFGTAGWDWLDYARGLGLTPLPAVVEPSN